MDAMIPDSWLRDYLKTDAKPDKIKNLSSQSGPLVQKLEKIKDDYLYHLEITTNRVDTAGVMGFARELGVILPQNGISAKFIYKNTKNNYHFTKKVNYLNATVDKSLCSRFTAVLIKNVKISPSPEFIRQRLLSIGLRPINNVVDISNYIMHDLGQPLHTFDYDKIGKQTMILRKSRKGEQIVTLDGKKYPLPGGDIIIEDGQGRVVDLAGIMGGLNSAVDENTKNVLLFVQTYNPANIRKTGMSLSVRSEAASLFEKGLDPELVAPATLKSIGLFEKYARGAAEKEILDIYPIKLKPNEINIHLDSIKESLGIDITTQEVKKILTSLGFQVSVKSNRLEIITPSYRTSDVTIPEDIVEEVARIYGYHKLPSRLLEGKLPQLPVDNPYDFESKIRNLLVNLGGVEAYTLSLVSGGEVDHPALKIKNPLGPEGEYLRTNLRSSLLRALSDNVDIEDKFFLFELANTYHPRQRKLPEEKPTLGGVFRGFSYQEAKGILESLLNKLNIDYLYKVEEGKGFLPGMRLSVSADKKYLGEIGMIDENVNYFEVDINRLKTGQKSPAFQPIPKFPPQIENLTFKLPERTKIGQVVKTIKSTDKTINQVDLIDTYQNAYTFRVYYQHPQKTLTNNEIEKIRSQIVKTIKDSFGGIVK